MELTDLKKGDRITHTMYGLGTVIQESTENAYDSPLVEFDIPNNMLHNGEGQAGNCWYLYNGDIVEIVFSKIDSRGNLV